MADISKADLLAALASGDKFVLLKADAEDKVTLLEASDMLVTSRQPASAAEGRTRQMDSDINYVDPNVHNALNIGGTEANPNHIGSTDHPIHGWRETGYTIGTADHAGNLHGYDTSNNQLAGIAIGNHHFLASDNGNGTHGLVIGGSYGYIKTGDYATIVGGTKTQAGGDQATVVGGTLLAAMATNATAVGGTLIYLTGEASGTIGARYALATGVAALVAGGQGSVHNTTLSSVVAEQATSISVASIDSEMAAGDVIRIELNNALSFMTTIGGAITGAGPYTIPLSDAIPGSGSTTRADSGNTVNFAFGHKAAGAQSAVLAGNNNQTQAIGAVAMGQDAYGAIRGGFFIGTEKTASRGDNQGFTIIEQIQTTSATDDYLEITDAVTDRCNQFGSNVVVTGHALVQGVGTSGASDGLVSSFAFYFSFKALGGTIGASDFTGTELHGQIAGDVTTLVNELSVVTVPIFDTNTAAACRIEVTSPTADTVDWTARLDCVMHHYS